MSTQFPDSGTISENTRKTSSAQPDWRGTIDVSPELAAQIAKDGKFDIACWNKQPGQYGKWMSAKVSVAYKKDVNKEQPKPAAKQMDGPELDAGF